MDAMIQRADKILMRKIIDAWADKILMKEAIDIEDRKILEARVLYSDNTYVEDNFRRFVIAHIYTNSARASDVELKERNYEEADCPMKTRRCYTYKRQELYSYNSVLFPYGVVFYSSHRVERRIPKKIIKLNIESGLTSAYSFTELRHLRFRYRARIHITEYKSTRDFHILM